MPAISVLMKPASSLCNMSCDYCFYCDESEKRAMKSYGFMSEETLKNIIRKTLPRAEGAASYAYQGGEPTLRGLDFFKKAVAFQNQYNRRRIPVHNAFQTNGYLLDEEWCRFFRENHFLVGVSVDGTPEIHDTLRHGQGGGKTFEQVAHSIKLMDEYGVDYNILTVVTPLVAENIAEVYAFYRENGWQYQQYIACLDPLGEERGKAPHALLPEVYGNFLIDLFSLWLKDLEKGRQPYIRQFENWVGLAAGYMAESCEQRGICGIQNVVEADGSIYPCDFYMLDEYRLGNFNEDRLEAIDEKRKALGFIERSGKLDEACGSCPYYKLCRGGCQRNRDFNETSGLYRNYFCRSYQLFFDRYYEKIMELGGQLGGHNAMSRRK